MISQNEQKTFGRQESIKYCNLSRTRILCLQILDILDNYVWGNIFRMTWFKMPENPIYLTDKNEINAYVP